MDSAIGRCLRLVAVHHSVSSCAVLSQGSLDSGARQVAAGAAEAAAERRM